MPYDDQGRFYCQPPMVPFMGGCIDPTPIEIPPPESCEQHPEVGNPPSQWAINYAASLGHKLNWALFKSTFINCPDYCMAWIDDLKDNRAGCGLILNKEAILYLLGHRNTAALPYEIVYPTLPLPTQNIDASPPGSAHIQVNQHASGTIPSHSERQLKRREAQGSSPVAIVVGVGVLLLVIYLVL